MSRRLAGRGAPRPHPLAFDFVLRVVLRGYERPRVTRAAKDVSKFVQDVVPPVLQKRLSWVRRQYLGVPMASITVPAVVVGEPGVQAYARTEAKRLEKLLEKSIQQAAGCQPVKGKTQSKVWTVLASPFKYKKHMQKLDEVVYTQTVTVKLPIRDEALEERLAAIPTWLPIGVEAQLVTQCVETVTCPTTLQDQRDIHQGRSLMEQIFGPTASPPLPPPSPPTPALT